MTSSLAAHRAASVLAAARTLHHFRTRIYDAIDLRGTARTSALTRARFALDATMWPLADADGRDPGLVLAARILADAISLALYGDHESLDALRRQVGYAPRQAVAS